MAATGTLRTTTCGHNPQSNGEIESWWRFWNRAMRFLSPSDYPNWLRFAKRICFAYNSDSHESIGLISCVVCAMKVLCIMAKQWKARTDVRRAAMNSSGEGDGPRSGDSS